VPDATQIPIAPAIMVLLRKKRRMKSLSLGEHANPVHARRVCLGAIKED
jgi:hypothetical protein